MSEHIKENALSTVSDNFSEDSLVKAVNVPEKSIVLETSSHNDNVATAVNTDNDGAVSNTENKKGVLTESKETADTVSSTDTPDGYLTITKTSAPDAIISDDNTVFTSEITIILTDYTVGANDAPAPGSYSLE